MIESKEVSLFENIEYITSHLEKERLADVFRFVSFAPNKIYPQHHHLRIEINFIKKGSCIIQLNEEIVPFKENELMIVCSDVEHCFQAGEEGCTLMQLEFLPHIFFRFHNNKYSFDNTLSPCNIFSKSNNIIKIVNNVGIVSTIQRIINEMTTKKNQFQYLVVLDFAELLIQINRHLNDNHIPFCSNQSIKKAIEFINTHYQQDITRVCLKILILLTISNI